MPLLNLHNNMTTETVVDPLSSTTTETATATAIAAKVEIEIVAVAKRKRKRRNIASVESREVALAASRECVV